MCNLAGCSSPGVVYEMCVDGHKGRFNRDFNMLNGVPLAVDSRFSEEEVSSILEGFADWNLKVTSIRKVYSREESYNDSEILFVKCGKVPYEGAVALTYDTGAVALEMVNSAIASHEIGHLGGVTHSENPKSVMYYMVSADSKPTEEEISSGFRYA